MRTIFTASTLELVRALSLVMLGACARVPVSAAPGGDPFAHVDWLPVFSALPGVTLTHGGMKGDESTIVHIGRFAGRISMDQMTEGDVNGTPMADIPLAATTTGEDGNLVFAMVDRRIVLEATFLDDDPRFAHALVSFANDRLMVHELHAATVDTTAFTFDGGRLHSDGTVTSSIEEFAKSRPSFFPRGQPDVHQ
jgi:hypothetical protein